MEEYRVAAFNLKAPFRNEWGLCVFWEEQETLPLITLMTLIYVDQICRIVKPGPMRLWFLLMLPHKKLKPHHG